MQDHYRYLEVERVKDAFCVHLKQPRMEESELQAFGEEFLKLINEDGCRKLVFTLGSNSPSVLFSLFLAKLAMVHRRLVNLNGAMTICAVNPDVMEVFTACQLDTYFKFAADRDSAIKAFS